VSESVISKVVEADSNGGKKLIIKRSAFEKEDGASKKISKVL